MEGLGNISHPTHTQVKQMFYETICIAAGEWHCENFSSVLLLFFPSSLHCFLLSFFETGQDPQFGKHFATVTAMWEDSYEHWLHLTGH